MARLFRKLGIGAALVSVALLAGCAFGTRQPTLGYPPASQGAENAAAQTAVKASPKQVQLVLKPFVDQRSDKRVVGTVRNALGMRTADVIPTNTVSDWVTQAMQTELRSHGYDIVAGDTMNARAAVISGEILNVFCDMYFSYTGQVSLVARVNREGKELFNKHYAGEGSAGLAVAMTAESYAQSLELALASALNQFIADLDRSLAAP